MAKTYIHSSGSAIAGKRKVYQTKTSNMSSSGETVDEYAAVIYALCEDETYVYCGGTTVRTVWKIRKADMTKIAESASYGGDIRCLAQDLDYIYCAGSGTRKVYKIRKSDMSKVAESIDYGGDIYGITVDNKYIYLTGSKSGDYCVWKLLKSNLAYLDKTSLATTAYAICNKGNYVYTVAQKSGGESTNNLKKINKTTMVIEKNTTSEDMYVYGIYADETYLYTVGNSQKVTKYLIHDLTLINQSSDYGATIRAIAVDDEYVYYGGEGASPIIRKAAISDLIPIDGSSNKVTLIYAISIEDTTPSTSYESYDPRDDVRQTIGTSIYDPINNKTTYNIQITDIYGKTVNIPLLLSEECRTGCVPTFPYIKMHRAFTTYVPHDVKAAVRRMVSYIDLKLYIQDIDNIYPYEFKTAILNKIQTLIRNYQKSVTGTFFMNVDSEREQEEIEGLQVTFIYIITLKCDKSDAC